ncbi:MULTISPECIES: polysaccharide deacetylase family protein [Psychrobacter]|uniref:polysaccharide deacetylase family protein n=1 Tax=Psychrobacter TaxID=497 RepID=UPI000EC5BB5C|nr:MULTISPECIES: polysaccharide deacetylase family protein [Psychrobacter]HCH27812.1 hypothetical protein [Psychrobacter sp.]
MVNFHDQALITFSYDDGRRNNFDIALPLHEKYGVNPSFAIIAGRTIDPEWWHRHMTPWEVSNAHERGAEIVSHGLNHKLKFTDLNSQELDLELNYSKDILKGLTSREQENIETICIPFSASNTEVLEKAYNSYQLVRIHGKKLNPIRSTKSLIYSFGLNNKHTFEDIKSLIDNAIVEKKWLVLMLHGVVEGDEAHGTYDITENLLNMILKYVREKSEETILPVTFKEVLQIREDNKKTEFYTPDIYKEGIYPIAESEGFLITYHKNKGNSNKVVLSFGGLPSKKTQTGFGSSFIMSLGYDHIFVAQEALSQYQKLSLSDFVAAVKPYIKDKEAYTYGSSLGAYAAIYYGSAIDAHIIASAPKNSAHPSMRKNKFENVVFNHDELVNIPKSDKPPLILFDPYRDEERKYIENYVLPAYPKSKLIKLPFAGHTVLNTLKESGLLKNFVTTYIEKGICLPLKINEEESYIWNGEKGRYFLRHSMYEEAILHFKKSLEIKMNVEAVNGLASTYCKSENKDQAVALIEDYFDKTGSLKGISPSNRNLLSRNK